MFNNYKRVLYEYKYFSAYKYNQNNKTTPMGKKYFGFYPNANVPPIKF